MRFYVPFDDIASGSTINVYTTMAALLAADTLGYRARLRRLVLGTSDDTPLDIPLAVKLARIDDVSTGTAGTVTASPTPTQVDTESRAAVIAGKTLYTVEPTTYGTALWQADLNRRNTIIEYWDDDQSAPVIQRDQLLGLLVAPRTAAAVAVSGCLEFEEF